MLPTYTDMYAELRQPTLLTRTISTLTSWKIQGTLNPKPNTTLFEDTCYFPFVNAAKLLGSSAFLDLSACNLLRVLSLGFRVWSLGLRA